MNNRANIMYFIEHLCDVAQRENHPEFVRMVQRDILRVIDAVAPADGTGAANVKVVRRVLTGLQQKSVLQAETVTELEECLKERDTSSMNGTSTNGAGGDAVMATPFGSGRNGVARLDKRQIEQRIEEDRERHKRLRESIWAVNANDDNEFERMWEDGSDVASDDFAAAEEDREERRLAVEYE